MIRSIGSKCKILWTRLARFFTKLVFLGTQVYLWRPKAILFDSWRNPQRLPASFSRPSPQGTRWAVENPQHIGVAWGSVAGSLLNLCREKAYEGFSLMFIVSKMTIVDTNFSVSSHLHRKSSLPEKKYIKVRKRISMPSFHGAFNKKSLRYQLKATPLHSRKPQETAPIERATASVLPEAS